MKRKWTIAAAILLIFCLMAAPAYAKAKTEKNISGELQTKTLSKKTVKLKWEKHKVDKYTIYKVVYDKNGNSKEKKLKTVSGKKTSVVIKAGKNAYLSLHIKGVKKSSNTVYNGFTTCWTGLATPEFDDYCYAKSPCSPSSITLDILAGGGMKPSGYQIYRKVKGAKKFKLIKTVKKSKSSLVWKDKSVKTGKEYIYKVRTYRGSGKKKYYSKMSETINRFAVNYNGKFNVSTETDGDQRTICLTSNQSNGDTVIKSADLYLVRILTDDPSVCYKVKSYSSDGSTWTQVVENPKKADRLITLSAGKSLWLRSEKAAISDDEYYDETAEKNVLSLSLSYRSVPCILTIDPDAASAKTVLNSEMIH